MADEHEHGTRARYKAGCECRRCRSAEAAYQKDRYSQRRRAERDAAQAARKAAYPDWPFREFVADEWPGENLTERWRAYREAYISACPHDMRRLAQVRLLTLAPARAE